MDGATIGHDCVLGQNVHIASDVQIGNRVKLQNNVSVYTGVTLEDDVFCGPSCVFTNVTNPRAAFSKHGKYETTLVKQGVTIGANATIVCGIAIGRYAFIGAGAVVCRDVFDYELMLGVPAVHRGWVSHAGHILTHDKWYDDFVCPTTGFHYREVHDGQQLACLDEPGVP